VNVGTKNSAASWIDWTDWDAANGQWCKKNGQCSDTQSGNATWTPNAHTSWNGCVTDRDQPYDVQNTAATGAALFPAEQFAECPTEMLPLSSDWTALNAVVDKMQPNGTTNQTIGLAWAWQTLSQGAPFNVAAPATDVQQVIILLSDGLNTQDRWYGNGSSVSTQVDDRMSKVCANAKAAGITIYTVQVNTDGDPTSAVLQNCATNLQMFFVLTSSGQMVTTFNQIGTSLAKLRIAK